MPTRKRPKTRHAEIVRMFVDRLRDAGYRAMGVGTFEAARHLLQTQPCDVLITDLRLAAYNGLHLVLLSQAVNPAALAVVLAEASDASSGGEAQRLGARYVSKASAPESLVELVGTMLEAAQTSSTSPSQPPRLRPRLILTARPI